MEHMATYHPSPHTHTLPASLFVEVERMLQHAETELFSAHKV